MKALACLALIGSAGLVFATPNPDDVQKRCTEQERQIAALEKEISALHSQIALERRLARGVDATPAAAGVSAASAGKATETYKVVSGDTLSSIARRYDTSSKALMSENGIEDPTRLRVGQSLKVPAAGEAKTTNPGTPLAKKTPPKKTPAGPYTVKTGDTFYKIARNHSLTVAKLEALNPGTDPGRIQIGQRLRVHIYDDRIEAFLGSTLVVSHPRARGRIDGQRIHIINYHHVIHALRRKPQALCNSIYRDSLFPRTEYAQAWKVLQMNLPRRDACRRMVDLLFIAHDRACEVELAHLLSAGLAEDRLPDPEALASRLAPKHMTLPKDVAVTHPSLDSFDALLGVNA